jgi:hypothetical protein
VRAIGETDDGRLVDIERIDGDSQPVKGPIVV